MKKILSVLAMTAAITGIAAIHSASAKVMAANHTPAAVADAFAGTKLSAALSDDSGAKVGTARILDTPKGLLLDFDLTHLPAGWHAIHIHAVGNCDDKMDHFKMSGGHFAKEGQQHGYLNADGPHAGDMPNFWVNDDGVAKFQVYDAGVVAADLTDEDGSAIIIHADPDDYQSQPAGAAGTRLACGIVK